MGINRENKDRLFKFIFGNEKNKAWTLSLYNAVNGSSYTNPEDIEFATIEDVLYMGMKDDIAFLITDMLNIYEQQSTFNPNMPMRYLIYLGMIYSKYTENHKHKINLYSTRQQRFPLPKLVCFYNGSADMEDRQELYLREAFDTSKGEPDVDVKVTMININYGRNTGLLQSCQVLQEYSWFIDRIRSNQEKTEDLEEAVEMTINEMPDKSLIKPFILANKAEVKRMCITEYDEAQTMMMFKEEGLAQGRSEGLAQGRSEGLAQGRSEGLAQGRLKILYDFVNDGIIDIEEAVRRANMTEEEFLRKTKEFQG